MVETIRYAYLMDNISPSTAISVIDAQEILYLRYQSFLKKKQKHWITIKQDEEADILNRFDIIIAMTEDDEKILRSMCPRTKTVICK